MSTSMLSGWLHNPWLCWGVGPYLASNLGFLVPALLLELLLIPSGLVDGCQIRYASSQQRPRKELLVDTHKRIAYRKQVLGSLKFIVGIPTMITSFSLVVIAQLLGMQARGWWPSSALEGLWQLLQLAVLADFGLYWGHRALHQSAFLWRFHAKHHAIDTPTPFSTLFIHPIDAMVQGSLPLMVAAILLQPHIGILYIFLAARIAENVLNHSGLDSPLVDVLTLKVLPLRASIAHHDAHHKYCNHPHNAKNFGESFWVWDALFGTTSALQGHAPAKGKVA